MKEKRREQNKSSRNVATERPMDRKRWNKSILEELSGQRKMLKEINKRKLRYLGHANRNTKKIDSSPTGKD